MNTSLSTCSLFLFTIFVLVTVAGCSATDTNEPTFDPSTEQLRIVTNQVPAFGGVLFEQDRLIVFVLRSEQIDAARDSLRDIFGTDAAEIDLQVRPSEGNASEDLKRSSRDVFSIKEVSSLDFDETTGYLRVGVTEVTGIQRATEKLKQIGTPLEQVILQVERPVLEQAILQVD